MHACKSNPPPTDWKDAPSIENVSRPHGTYRFYRLDELVHLGQQLFLRLCQQPHDHWPVTTRPGNVAREGASGASCPANLFASAPFPPASQLAPRRPRCGGSLEGSLSRYVSWGRFVMRDQHLCSLSLILLSWVIWGLVIIISSVSLGVSPPSPSSPSSACSAVDPL